MLNVDISSYEMKLQFKVSSVFIPPTKLLDDDDDLKWCISIHKDTVLCVICVPRVRCSKSHIDVATATCNIEASTTPTRSGGLFGRDNVQLDISEHQHFELFQNFEHQDF
ncbi:hypothetical protein Adt_26861 [Abeliophyllum distichum]|uniref:Uncharacterized protein n=1 Tax=Abeliophyllum distichum TaxID=126358 RepID=A0ABD1RSB4_9LAMI